MSKEQTFEEFKGNVSEKFSNILTTKDEKVVFNFWNNSQEVTEQLNTGQIKIALHSRVLSDYTSRWLPQREMFLKLCRVSTIVLLLSLVAFFVCAVIGWETIAEIMFITMFITMFIKSGVRLPPSGGRYKP